MESKKRVVLVTGASSGIGKQLALSMAEKGYRVYGTSRKAIVDNQDQVAADSNNTDGFFKLLQLDVCDEDSIKKSLQYLIEQEGVIDVLINNAGFGIAGSVEDTSSSEAFSQFDVNFFGVHRMCRNVLPYMRDQNSGLIVNIGSLAGIISIPYQSMYSSSKSALEAMSEVLRIEAAQFGIKVVLVEPGDIKTNFTANRTIVAGAGIESAYHKSFVKGINTMIESENKGIGPQEVVNQILSIVEMKNPPIRKIVGFTNKIFYCLKRVLPSRLVEYLISKSY
jgi:short-subunit dehydrogenase